MSVIPLRMFRSITLCQFYNGTPCWIWTGVTMKSGYGKVWFNGRNRSTHRVVYELLVGPIPEGLQLDHLCRNRSCCNPQHLEPVTCRENVRRGITAEVNRQRQLSITYCVNGHLYDETNTRNYTNRKGDTQRICRECHKERSKLWAASKRRIEGKPIRIRSAPNNDKSQSRAGEEIPWFGIS